MFDFFMICVCAALGLASHGAATKRWLEWALRVLIGIFCAFESIVCLGANFVGEAQSAWSQGILETMTVLTGIELFKVCRGLISAVLTTVEYVFSGRILVALIKKQKIDMFAERIFQPTSIPHMVALFIYIQTMAYMLLAINPQDMGLPNLTMPIPIPFLDLLGQLFSYNGVGLVILAFCGVGVFVSRRPRQCMARLGWEKPTGTQIGIGILLIFATFLYDYLWSIYGGGLHQDLGAKLSMYNSGTFQVVGGFGPSVILALFTALCAGIGEETLTRGAIQPALGIIPAGIMHGALHAQFAHAPFFILEIAGWSCLMGIVRKYTNTTTTIIGHAGYNFLTTFLFAFNP